jgi:hypothetical protein
MEEVLVVCFKVTFIHLPEWTKEKMKELPLPRSDRGISRIQTGVLTTQLPRSVIFVEEKYSQEIRGNSCGL